MAVKAVFLDKDGTLIANVPNNTDLSLVRFLPGAEEALGLFHGLGYKLCIVTNQPGVANGLFTEEEVRGVGSYLGERLRAAGAPLAAFCYCPHHPEGKIPEYRKACFCRKPAPGMILKAARRLGADPRRSWLLGDTLDDVEAGHSAGCRSILIDNGGETEWVLSPARRPDVIVRDLAEAAEVIREQEASGGGL